MTRKNLSSGGEESDDSLSLSEETRQAMREARKEAKEKKKKKKKRKKNIDDENDDGDDDDLLKSAPLPLPKKKKQKARMGQRQRRLLAEQQYGRSAKHVIAEQESRGRATESRRDSTMHPRGKLNEWMQKSR